MTATVEGVANISKPHRLSHLKVHLPKKEVFFLVICMVIIACLIWMFASPIVKHTEFWSNVRWTLFFLAFSAIGPFMALFAVGLSPAIFTVTAGASLISSLSEGVNFGKAVVDGAWAGLIAVFMIPLFLLFAGPYGLYHFTWQPIMQFLDGADHTLCCYDLETYTPDRDKEYFPTFNLSPDGKWIVMMQKNSPSVGPENTLIYVVDTEKGGAVKWFGSSGYAELAGKDYWKTFRINDQGNIEIYKTDRTGAENLKVLERTIAVPEDKITLFSQSWRSGSVNHGRYSLVGNEERTIYDANDEYQHSLVNFIIHDALTGRNFERIGKSTRNAFQVISDVSGVFVFHNQDDNYEFWDIPNGKKIREVHLYGNPYDIKLIATNEDGTVWIFKSGKYIKIISLADYFKNQRGRNVATKPIQPLTSTAITPETNLAETNQGVQAGANIQNENEPSPRDQGLQFQQQGSNRDGIPKPTYPASVLRLIQQMITASRDHEDEQLLAYSEQLAGISKPQRGNFIMARQSNQDGMNYLRQHQPEEALKSFLAAYQNDPSDAEITNNLGYALSFTGNQALAEQYLYLAIAISPGRPYAWLNLGLVYAVQGRQSDAVECFIIAHRMASNPEKVESLLEQISAKNMNTEMSEAAALALNQL